MGWRERLGIVHRLWETLGDLHERGIPLGGFALSDVVLEGGRTELPRLRIEGKLGGCGAEGFARDRASLEALAEHVFAASDGLSGVFRALGAEGRAGLGREDELERRLRELERAGESVLEGSACLREVVEHAALVARREQFFRVLTSGGAPESLLEVLSHRWARESAR